MSGAAISHAPTDQSTRIARLATRRRRAAWLSAATLAIAAGSVSAPAAASVLEVGADGSETRRHWRVETEWRDPVSGTGLATARTGIDRAIRNAASAYAFAPGVRAAGLSPDDFHALLHALIAQESGFDPKAVSPKGAMGLGQIMPATARELGLEDPFDVEANLDAAARYLAAQLARFGSVELALAAYNSGPQAVAEHGGVPPFPETRGFVAAILRGAGLDATASMSPARPILVMEFDQ